MENIDMSKVLIGCAFRDAYKLFLLESNERKRNERFNYVLPTIDKQIAYIFSYLGIKDNDLQTELRQMSHIKVFTKITLERIHTIKNLNGYVRTVAINTIRDYFGASNNYNRYRRGFKLMIDKGLDTYGKVHVMESNETPQSDLIIKPII